MRIQITLSILFLAFAVSACTGAAETERADFARLSESRAAEWNALLDRVEKAEGGAPPRVLRGDLTLAEIIRLAEIRSPRLGAAYYKWEAAVKRITLAVELPNPTIAYAEFINSIETRLGPIQRKFMFEQKIPFPGKLVAKQEIAAGKAAAMKANFEATRLGLRQSVVLAYIDLQALDARRLIIAELTEILRAIEGVVEARVTTNLAPQSALLRVQVEGDRLMSEEQSLDRRRPALVAALRSASGARIAEGIRVAALPTPRLTPLPGKEKLAALVMDHPSVQARFAQVAVARGKVNAAGWMWYPNFMFGLEYTMVGDSTPGTMKPPELGEDAFALKVGLTIPWQVHVNSSRSDAARAEEKAARLLAAQQRLDLDMRLEKQTFGYDDAIRVIRLYEETVLPKARQTLELVRTDFIGDRATLTDVLDAERMLFASELSLINARAGLLQARARIESLIARDLDSGR